LHSPSICREWEANSCFMAKRSRNMATRGPAIVEPVAGIDSHAAPIPACESSSRAFTLIELLVVVAIIGILAGLLLSALSLAKGQAQSAYCKNNLRQQGLAFQMYIDDTQFYPYYQTPGGVQWEITLEPYYPAPNAQSNSPSQSVMQNGPPSLAYQCPAYASMVTSPYYYPEGQWCDNWSYAYNIWGSTYRTADAPNLDYCLGPGVDAPWLWELITTRMENAPGSGNPYTSTNLPACRESYVMAPSQLFTLMDSRGTGTNPWTGLDWTAGIQDFPILAPQPQHGTVFNVLFGEGHVTETPLTTLFNPAIDAQNWNVDYQPHPNSWQTQSIWAP
jgi:prepilin-type N-terminal cleavage/methylation domain-containing protein